MSQPPTAKPTEMQGLFIEGLAAGLSQTEAARRAGYAHPGVQAVRLVRHPGVRAAVSERVTGIMQSGIEPAAQFMVNALRDESLPPETRRKCAAWILDAAGFGPASAAVNRNREDLFNKPTSEMTYDELLRLAASSREHLAEIRAIEVVPDADPEPVEA